MSVSGDANGRRVVILESGIRAPKVGGTLLVPASEHAPSGVLGVVISESHLPGGALALTTRPGTLEDAYSSFDVRIDGALSQLTGSSTVARVGAVHSAASLGALDPSFSCDKPDVQRSLTHNLNLSNVHLSASVAIPSPANGYYGPGVSFLLTGQPQFTFGVHFTGTAACTAKATINIPIPEVPGLIVAIGPQFKLSADGSVGAQLVWSPHVTFGFDRYRSGPNDQVGVFKSAGTANFTGAASLKLSLALSSAITLAGRIGVSGTIGPTISGNATAQATPRATCLAVGAELDANLGASANVFFRDYHFTLGSWTFGKTQLYHACGNGGNGGGGSVGGGGSPNDGGGTGQGSGDGNGGETGPPVPAGGMPQGLAGGAFDTCAWLSDGTVDCWGDNGYGELGVGNTGGQSTTPTQVTGLDGVSDVTAGFYSACAVKTDGHLYCWGLNTGQANAGGGLTGPTSSPDSVDGITNATSVAIGGWSYNSCAVLSAGSVRCWGENDSGQLGDGSDASTGSCVSGGRACSATPVAVTGLTDATEVGVGSGYACALLSGGGVDCWGDSKLLGNGTTTGPDACDGGADNCSTSPTAVSGIANATQISAGPLHACVLASSGSVKCWGYNDFGALGNGTTTDFASGPTTTPVAVSGISDATELATGDDPRSSGRLGEEYTCALLSTGTVKCWGTNRDGLGAGTTTSSTVPVQVDGITDAVHLVAGGDQTCALLSDGGVKCWGANDDGELGNGTTTNSSSPVPVTGYP